MLNGTAEMIRAARIQRMGRGGRREERLLRGNVLS